MFLFKKIVGPFFFPLTLCLGFLLLGLVLLWLTRRQRSGRILVTLGTLLLLFFSLDPTSNLILGALEQRYPPVASSGPQSSSSNVKYIVVLSGGIISDPKLPLASQMSSATLIRLVEGIRLQREVPGAKLLLSGGRGFNPVPEAEIMRQVARSLGVSQQDILVEAESLDTEEQARIIKDLVGRERFILLTSAAHLPRVLALFRKQGMEPLPYPVGQLARKAQAGNPEGFFPHAVGPLRVEIAFHEYLGLAWAKLRGLI
jgi:uncharacterized SAM-binding protein YcdF (DUF218 family)